MSTEKREYLIANGLLDPDTGERPTHVVTAEEAGVSEEVAAGLVDGQDATADAEVVVADTVDPNQEAQP